MNDEYPIGQSLNCSDPVSKLHNHKSIVPKRMKKETIRQRKAFRMPGHKDISMDCKQSREAGREFKINLFIGASDADSRNEGTGR